jgi:hypothetical protein
MIKTIFSCYRNHLRFFITLFLVTIFAFSLAQCASGITSRKLLYRDFKSGYYSYDLEEIAKKDSDLIKQPLKHPIKSITKEEILAALGNLKFKKESSVGNMIYYVFAKEELDDLIQNIVISLAKIREDQVLVVVSKFNDIKSVVSRDNRTSFLVFVNEDGLNLVFGEVHQDMIGIETENYYEWSVIQEIQLRNNFNPIRIIPSDEFTFAKVKDYENRMWLQFSMKSLPNLKYKNRKSEEPKVEILDKDASSSSKTEFNQSTNSILRDLD